jgi:guanylate kinase
MEKAQTTMSDTELFDLQNKAPLILVISGLSGVGKDAAIGEMKKRKLDLHFVVTMNTRKPRSNEIEGVDYLFVSEEEFFHRVNTGQMAEHARVYDDWKGVPRWQIDQAIASGRDVIMRLDVQGAQTIKQNYPQAVMIFLAPSDLEEWKTRFSKRGSESEEARQRRIDQGYVELTQVSQFDYVIINRDGKLEETVDRIEAIITAEHCRPRKDQSAA